MRRPDAAPEAGAREHAEPTTLGGFQVGSPVIRKALLYSFWDGILCNGMIALNETFAVAAAVTLHAPPMAIALLSALPLLLGSLAQYFWPAAANPLKGRKHYVLLGVRMQAVFLFVAAFMGWLPGAWAVWGYVIAFAMASVSANATGAFWMAWMGDLIPGSARGRHFAWRSVFFAWAYLSCSLLAGTISREYTSHNTPWVFFACVFALAALFRFGSYQFLRRQYEPPTQALELVSPFKFRPSKDFLTYCLATAAFQGAATMSGPFFGVWYLRDLHYDFFFLSVSLCCSVFGSMAFAGFWGKMADNFGTSRVLRLSGLMVAVIPLPYLFLENQWALWALSFYSGSTWSGYNLANFNHMLNATDKAHRAQYLAFFSLMVGVIGFTFSMLGGFLASRLPALFGTPLRSLFLLSLVIRTGVFFALFGKFHEYRESLPCRSDEVFKEFPGFRLGMGLFRTASRAFRAE